MTPARAAALDALDEVRDHGRAADDALADAFAARPTMAVVDRALAQELAYGVLRWRTRLDIALGGVCPKGLPKDPRLLDLLRLGAYALLFLERVPPHATVSTAVEAAKARGLEHASGFVNGALRALARRRDEQKARSAPGAGAPLAALAEWFSVPVWMAEAFAATVGRDALAGLLEASNRPAPLVLRASPAAGREAILARLQEAEVEAAPARFAPDAIVVTSGGVVTDLPGFAEGAFAVQDEAAQLVAMLLGEVRDLDVLDVCAAPGGKAIHAAHLGARVLAVDADAKRLARVEEAARRLHAEGLVPIRAEATAGREIAGLEGRRFARVLVDAPCSGSGILRRKPDVKWARRPEDVPRLAAKQRDILDAAARHVAEGGRLVYAVCSLFRDEGEGVVERFLRGEQGAAFAVVDVAAAVPLVAPFRTEQGHFRARPDLHGTDGFFAALLERRPSAS